MPASLSALSHLALRTEIIETCREMNASGVNQGTSGNVSVRIGDGRFLVTPTGIPYAGMTEDQIVEMTFDGIYYGPCRPTSEWRFHRDILLHRPDIDTVIHTHSMFSTVISCLRRDIPAVHYMVAAAGGENIRCADYATFGSQALSDHALTALEGRLACLLANHGLIVLGANLRKALALLVEVETIAAQYWRALAVGTPVILDSAEMQNVFDMFKVYGRQDVADPELRCGGAIAPAA
ncbi:class II aldolase/adducin family protein [Pleomorphomonas carboxyditropha]|uniref:Class II aldolase n=1 Tax=Pleomorphomonas carboxyditropha TaxID=2023338 RepID=A0A2G9WR75_9HYPH|nr:class II aldolase/adducin family protein [Pleomorphomonas carboxyditropha]PIO97221.1 class II aldolase [Pleomorphomonas carboxyditropha]